MSFDNKLITEVQKHPFLYDFDDKDYKNTALRDLTWNKIGFALDTDVEICKKKWRNFRDTHKKRQKRTAKLTTGSLSTRPWKHGKRLAFLDNCSSSRKFLTTRTSDDTMMDFNSEEESSLSDHNNFDDDIQIENSNCDQPIDENCKPETINVDAFNDDNSREDAVSLVSSTSLAVPATKESVEIAGAQEEKLPEFYEIKRRKSITNERDSLSLLFESLDKKVHEANLTYEQITELESSVFSLVFFRLSEYRKINNNKNKE